MSCCCSSPEQALIGAAIFTLIVFVPCGFYGLVEICFHYAEQEHQSLSVVSTITCVGAVLLAVVGIIGKATKSLTTLYAVLSLSIVWTAFAAAMTIWGAVVATQSEYLDLEGKILSAGTVVIFCIGFALTPLCWFSYEVYAYRRQLREGGASMDEHDAEKAFLEANATTEMSRYPLHSAAELGAPRGRTRRGTYEGNYREMSSASSEGNSSEGEVETKRSRSRGSRH